MIQPINLPPMLNGPCGAYKFSAYSEPTKPLTSIDNYLVRQQFGLRSKVDIRYCDVYVTEDSGIEEANYVRIYVRFSDNMLKAFKVNYYSLLYTIDQNCNSQTVDARNVLTFIRDCSVLVSSIEFDKIPKEYNGAPINKEEPVLTPAAVGEWDII